MIKSAKYMSLKIGRDCCNLIGKKTSCLENEHFLIVDKNFLLKF